MTTKSEPPSVSDLFQGEFLAYVYSPSEILINLATAFVLALVIAFTYRATHRGLSYSQSFVLSPDLRDGNHRDGRYGDWE